MALAAAGFLLGSTPLLFAVPLYALIQERSPKAEQARMVATDNVVNAGAIAAGAAATAGLAVLGATPASVLLGCAGLNLVVAGWTARTLARPRLAGGAAPGS